MDKFLRAISIFGHKTGVYGWWHRVRRKGEDTSDYLPLPKHIGFQEVLTAITDRDSVVWRRDTPKWALWDRISGGRRWWTRRSLLDDGAKIPAGLTHSVDCDEATTCAIELLRIAAKDDDTIHPDHIYLLQVVWRDVDGGFHGHHVCAFQKLSSSGNWTWQHLSNWGLYDGGFAKDGKLRAGMGVLATRIAEVRAGGVVIHAHACMDPDNLKDWRLVV